MLSGPWMSVAFSIVSSGGLAAQGTIATLYGPADTELGTTVAGIADLNGDGIRDVVVGMPRASTPSGGFSGRVRVYSGAFLLHGTQPDVLYEWDGDPGLSVRFGGAVAAGGDVNADGVPDIAVGATGDDQGGLSTDCGSVRVFSGATGAVLATFYGGGHKGLGVSVAFVGDVNHDGFDDVAGGETGFASGPTFPGKVWVWSGEWITRTAAGQTPLTPMILCALTGVAGGDEFGATVSAAGDVDHDGFADFAVGARHGGANLGGYVQIFSGATGAVLATIDGSKAYDYFGAGLASAGDVNRDGWDDLAIGAPGVDLGGTSVNTNFGQVVLLSGEWVARTALGQTPLTPEFLLVVNGSTPGDTLGLSMASLGDLDFDGVPDLALGAPQEYYGPPTGAGYVEIVSGRTGAILARSDGVAMGDAYGHSVAAAGDFDQDGIPDVVVGAPENTNLGAFGGMLRVVRGLDLVGAVFCTALPNSTGVSASIMGHGVPSVSANRLLLTADGIQPGSNGIFFYGTGQTSSPLGNGNLCIGGSQLFRLGVVTADASGRLVRSIDLQAPPSPAGAISAGSTWNFQAYYRDTPAGGAGFNLSNALSVLFRP